MELLGLAQKERNSQFAKNGFMVSLLARNSSGASARTLSGAHQRRENQTCSAFEFRSNAEPNLSMSLWLIISHFDGPPGPAILAIPAACPRKWQMVCQRPAKLSFFVLHSAELPPIVKNLK
jgi:hypothetical protein